MQNMNRTWSSVLLIVFLFCNGFQCRRRNEFVEEELGDDTPQCSYDGDSNIVACFYLNSTTMYLLQEALQSAAQTEPSFGLHVGYSDGPSIPTDMLPPFNISLLSFLDCNFSAIPYQLLTGLNSQLTQLYMETDTFLSTETTTTESFLQFSEFLSVFALDNTNIQTINPATFSQYTNLNEIYLENNDISSIGLEFLGLFTLEILHLSDNDISYIETGAFRDLNNITIMDLYDNNLSYLQEGAFMGLETSPITDMDLGGNPWNCTCDLQWLKDWLDERNLTKSSVAFCAYPIEGYFYNVDFC